MEIKYAALSSAGPVRDVNEDRIGFWQPETSDELLVRGSVAILADGVGGQGSGAVASGLAVDAALAVFKQAKPGMPRPQLLQDMFRAANLAVYDAGIKSQQQHHMATTLTISIFGNNDVAIGHVGDCRVFLLSGGHIRCLTTDHSYVAMQQRLGLVTREEAANSSLSSMLTRSVGQDMTIAPDILAVPLHKHDCLVQCCDGVHTRVPESDLLEVVSRNRPEESCRRLLALAERRGADDNLSVQVIEVDAVEQVAYFLGQPYFEEGPSAPMSHELQPGSVLDERFTLTEVVSRSGMATIFKATDARGGQTVAVKVPFMQYESDPAFYSRFEREEEIGKTLDHPNILRIVPVENKSRPYLVMEFLQGQTLGSLLRNVKRLPVADALRIAGRICEALDYMHRRRNNIVHRDLKPDNIMLCDDGSLRIMDFGIAKATGVRRITFGGFSPTVGTPDYMAPEQVKGQRGDERTDIYSLGVILYEMLTGRPPFEGHNAYTLMNARLLGDPVAPRKIVPEIPPQVEELVLHALERRPDDRYQSAAEMKEELDAPDNVKITGREARLRPFVVKPPWAHWVKVVVFYIFGPLLLAIIFFLILNTFARK